MPRKLSHSSPWYALYEILPTPFCQGKWRQTFLYFFFTESVWTCFTRQLVFIVPLIDRYHLCTLWYKKYEKNRLWKITQSWGFEMHYFPELDIVTEKSWFPYLEQMIKMPCVWQSYSRCKLWTKKTSRNIWIVMVICGTFK